MKSKLLYKLILTLLPSSLWISCPSVCASVCGTNLRNHGWRKTFFFIPQIFFKSSNTQHTLTDQQYGQIFPFIILFSYVNTSLFFSLEGCFHLFMLSYFSLLIFLQCLAYFINLSIHQYINSSIYQFINSSIHQFINLSIHRFINSLTDIIPCCQLKI